MKNILTVLFFTFSALSLSGQNPIIKEELFEDRNGEWIKVSITNRAFDDLGNLTYREILYFDDRVQRWLPYIESRFDANGNTIETTYKSFQSEALGFSTNTTLRQFNDTGDLLVEESFVQENKDSETILLERKTNEYIENCTYLQRVYQRNNDASLELSSLRVFL